MNWRTQGLNCFEKNYQGGMHIGSGGSRRTMEDTRPNLLRPLDLTGRTNEAAYFHFLNAPAFTRNFPRFHLCLRRNASSVYQSVRVLHDDTKKSLLKTNESSIQSFLKRIPVRRLMWVPVVLGTAFAGGIYLSVHPDYTEKRRLVLTAKGMQRFLR